MPTSAERLHRHATLYSHDVTFLGRLATQVRRLASAIAIPTSSIAGSVLAILVWPFQSQGRISFAISRHWASFILWIGGVKVEVRHSCELADEPYVFVANHASNLDIWLLLAHLQRDFRFISKKEWGRLPLFGWAMRASSMIFIDRGNSRNARESIVQAAARISGGLSIVLFPEGSRSRSGELREFKRGAMHLALRAKAALVPIAIRGAFSLMPPGRFSIVPGKVVLDVGRPIETSSRTFDDRHRLASEAHEQIRAMLAAAGS